MNNKCILNQTESSIAPGSTTLAINIQVLWSARFFIILFTSVCSLLFIVSAYFILPATFKSSTIILPPSDSSSIFYKTQNEDFKSSYKALTHFFKSEYLQHKLRTDHGFDIFFSGSADLLRDSLVMDGDKATGLITISSISTDPQLAYSRLQIILQELNDFFLTVYETDADLAQKAIARRLEKIKSRITILEAEYRSHKNSNSAVQLELQTNKQIYKDLRMQNEMVDIIDSAHSVRFEVLKEPTVPNHEYGPNRLQLSIIFAASAFLCSILIVFIRNGLAIDYRTSQPSHRVQGWESGGGSV